MSPSSNKHPALHPPLPFSTSAASLAARRPEFLAGETLALEWAFAGTSTRTAPKEDGSQYATWTHELLDSRQSDTHATPDAGTCYPESAVLADGAIETWEREEGSMFNPDLGREARYVEGWREVPIPTVDDGLVVLALRYDTPDGVRGLIIRVDDYVQGILRRADGTYVTERWIRRADATTDATTAHPKFELVFASGEGDDHSLTPKGCIGCDLAFGMRKELAEGDDVEGMAQRVWRVIEVLHGGKGRNDVAEATRPA
jgi:hypothetical protein